MVRNIICYNVYAGNFILSVVRKLDNRLKFDYVADINLGPVFGTRRRIA